MPFDRHPDTGKLQFSFTNLLAVIITLSCFFFLFWVALTFSKAEARENTLLIQVVTVITATLTSIVMFYFGSSNNSAKQAQQITEMQKTATTVALTTATANAAAATTTAANTEVKIDKAVKLEQLKAELAKYPPDHDEAIRLANEIAELEKIS